MTGSARDGNGLVDFLHLMRRMRAEDAWKAAQTHRSLARYLLEEAHETVEAIESGDLGHLQEELGDLLLQVYFQVVIAEDAGEFTMDDVVDGLTAKMIRRNPHIFDPADGPRPTYDELVDSWQAVKTAEKPHRTSPADGIPASLPALLYADKVLNRTEYVPGDGDLGDRLLALAAEAHAQGLDPEQELREAVRRLVDQSST